MATIPEDQRLCLGQGDARLGRSCYVGERIPDRMGKFRLELGPVSAEVFQDLLPGGDNYETLQTMTRAYVTDSLEYDVEIALAKGQASTACLGSPAWSRLGLDTWLLGREEIGEVRARFCPEQ
jgi:type VI secretion system protein ImpH